ncbi:iron (metal) dependent repressor, DtxR family [Desulfarculus baarsii DSM 2075]|uniref:Transcriptional regulator MntR n=1 Tax=Desulfarculus baarsii (strain ATCC 33931 / DSM 2075 / LMG 7858 / VKM B-1802 / 2st14) TaxID=644282 RepID=E1QG24_DESB2|nr:metal-dependent transcriptional regulator [Desulfarculus baarsii]ADK84634.1 iron (metal) dependent repressor, DtxR family [Desulfarculus baarsii DSM 2075]
MSTTKHSGDHQELTPQLEDYLETIALLQEQSPVARAKDIADRLGVTPATVTSALRSLAEKGLINYQPYSHITLTDQGRQRAQDVLRRHEVLSEFFGVVLRAPSRQAEDNACRAEHVLDPDIIERMVRFLSFLKNCPRTGQVWREAFERFCHEKPDHADCKECVGRCLAELYAPPAE